jgi:prepilin-type N-terminal cleavage/methylation domain-containing protein
MLFGYFKSRKGFSLVEVLVSTVLITLVFGGFVSAYYYSTNLRVNSQKRLDAVLTAQACIEEIRSARGDTSAEWENRLELENWLENIKSYSDIGGGEFQKDNVKITLGEVPQGNPAVLIPAGLFNLTVEVYYSDEMDKVKKRYVVLETRLGEL